MTTNRTYGYARVSTSQQSLDLQIKQLMEAGVERNRILTDKATGSNTEREGLQILLLKVEEGDEVFVCKLDRLGRDTRDMLDIIDEFKQKGVSVTFLSDGISTKGAMGEMVITILSAVAQAERARILERTNEGRLEAQANGVKFGRPKEIDEETIKLIKADIELGIPKTKVCEKYKVSRSTLYRVINEDKEGSGMVA